MVVRVRSVINDSLAEGSPASAGAANMPLWELQLSPLDIVCVEVNRPNCMEDSSADNRVLGFCDPLVVLSGSTVVCSLFVAVATSRNQCVCMCCCRFGDNAGKHNPDLKGCFNTNIQV